MIVSVIVSVTASNEHWYTKTRVEPTNRVEYICYFVCLHCLKTSSFTEAWKFYWKNKVISFVYIKFHHNYTYKHGYILPSKVCLHLDTEGPRLKSSTLVNTTPLKLRSHYMVYHFFCAHHLLVIIKKNHVVPWKTLAHVSNLSWL